MGDWAGRKGGRVTSAEGQLLRRCLVGDVPFQWDEQRLDPARLIDALRSHRISCTLHPVLSPLPGLPLPVKDFIQGRRLEMTRSLLAMQADLGVLAALLDDLGVPWVVMKGPVAAETLYGGLHRREWSDLDIAVDRRRFGDVLSALDAAGVRLIDRNWGMIAERMQAELSLQLPHGTSLDLHWHLLNGRELRSAFRVEMDSVLADRQPLQIGQAPVWGLAQVDQLLHLALHTCFSGAHRLQWLKDVQLAMIATSDWERVVQRAHEWGTQLPTALVLERTAAVLGAPVPPGVLDSLAAPAGWRAAGRLATRLSPPEDSHLDRRSGRVAFMHTRRDTLRTAKKFMGSARVRRRKPDVATTNPLHEPSGTSTDRARYLADVSAPRVL